MQRTGHRETEDVGHWIGRWEVYKQENFHTGFVLGGRKASSSPPPSTRS